MPQALSTTETFLIAMVIILAVPWLIWRLARTDRYAPLVVVQILCGILLGPGVLGAAYPGLDDIAIWAVLAFILLDWERVGRQLGFLLVFALAAVAMRAVMNRLGHADRWPVSLIWLAACSLGADWSGLHFMVGAFLAGAVLDAEMFERAALDAFRNMLLLTLMPVYFLSAGLKAHWEVGGFAVFGAAALLFAASIAGKLIGTVLAGRLLGWRKGDGLAVGLLLQTKGLVMIVFANVLLDEQIISGDSFTALLLLAVASTMLTVPMVKPRLKAPPEPEF